MPRRVSLPGADELFRDTQDGRATAADDPVAAPLGRVGDKEDAAHADGRAAGTGRRPSGRVRHDEKITVYVTADELLSLEHTRLLMRRDHGLAVDRGRLVREAMHLALEDAAANGADSALVRRLQEQ